MPLELADLGDELRQRVIASCREREPTAIGILVYGSYAAGRADADSDLDLEVLVSGEPTVHYRIWFEARDGQRPLHISARCDLTFETWDNESQEPEDWALGLPVEVEHVWLWCGNESVRKALGERPLTKKPGAPAEIEDMVDAVLKMRRHARHGDELGARLEAQAAARRAAPTVAALNSPAPVTDPRSALDTILALKTAPSNWRADLTIAMGLTDKPLPVVLEAVDRLVLGTLHLAGEINPHVDEQPETARYLADGTLEGLLA